MRSIIRRALLIALLLATTGVVSAQNAEPSLPVLTLDQAKAEAQQNNRQVKISSENVAIANDEILSAKTQRYPHFNVQFSASGLLTPITVHIPEGTFGYVDSQPVPSSDAVITTEPKFSSMGTVQIYQPLTDLYSAHLNIELLKVGKQLSQEQLRQQRQQIVNSVEENYYGLLQTQSALSAAEENLKALKEVDRTTDQFVKEKTALAYQGSGVKVQVAQAELQITTLQDTLQTQKENLNVLMGRDIREDFRLAPVPDSLPEEQDLDTARKSALSGRTEIRQAQFKIEQANYSRRIQKSQYIPEIGLQYEFIQPFTIQGYPGNINAAGFTLKWDLWDWGNKRHLLDEKTRNIEQSQLSLTETSNQVLLDLDNHFRKLREARASLSVADLAQQAEAQKLQVVTEQYKQKAALLSTLQTEQANMALAASQYQQALTNFWSARADFEKSLGKD